MLTTTYDLKHRTSLDIFWYRDEPISRVIGLVERCKLLLRRQKLVIDKLLSLHKRLSDWEPATFGCAVGMTNHKTNSPVSY